MRKNKGQGALEYLLLIGGAVLIAVIVIALLVGMGGQSRDQAKDQADTAAEVMTQPTSATITEVRTEYADCNADKADGTADANLTFSWIPGDGDNQLILTDNDGNPVQISLDGGITWSESVSLNPNNRNSVALHVNEVTGCGDTHKMYVETTKNNIPITSMIKNVDWAG
jgi:hypothetical protein